MKEMSELYSIFKSLYMEIMTQFDASIHVFSFDNAREYFHTVLSQFLDDHGIIFQSSCPFTPQNNSVAKCILRHLLEVAQALLLHMNVHESYCIDVVLTACYLINHMPSSALCGQIPFTALSLDKPLFQLSPKIFGCVYLDHSFRPWQCQTQSSLSLSVFSWVFTYTKMVLVILLYFVIIL